MQELSRRIFLGAAAALGPGVISGEPSQSAQSASGNPAASRSAPPKPWNPKLGILANFSEGNVRFAKNQGFKSIGLFAHYKTTLDLNSPLPERRIAQVRSSLKESGLYLSVIGCHQPNHIAGDLAERARSNEYFLRAIELAGELGASYVGTCSGKIPEKPLAQQVDEILRVYSEKGGYLLDSGGPNL
jgi:hypothetical protein